MVRTTPAQKRSLKGKADYRAIKEQALQVYGTTCTCCGEARLEFLTFNHTNGDGAAHRAAICGNHRAAGAKFVRALAKLGFPPVPGLEVQCFNCHMASDLYGCCPHQLEKIKAEREGRAA